MTHPKKRTTKPKNDDPEEYKRFLKTAKEVEADEDPKAMERAFTRVVPPGRSAPVKR